MRKIINSYSFGKIVIDGKTYNSDLIIYPDKIKTNWWRKSGHQLIPEDIRDIIKEKVEVLIVGTGAFGLMVVSDEVKEILRKNNIKLMAQKSERACKTYNSIPKDKKVVLALHLTC